MAIQSFTTTETTSRTRTMTYTLPNLKSISSIKVNTGNVTVTNINGEQVTVQISGGAYTRRVQTGGSYTPADTKFVTNQTSTNYNSGGYTGTLTQYVHSGIYTPADTKFVTNQTSRSYNSGGYTGTLTQYISHYEPTIETKTETYSMWLAGYRTPEQAMSQYPTYFYNKDGYSGTLNAYHASSSWEGDSATVYYSGTVTKIGPDAPVYRYQGNVTKPASDTRVYRYEGSVTKPASDTRTYASYYQYTVTIDYIDNLIPIITVSKVDSTPLYEDQSTTINRNVSFPFSFTANDEDVDDTIEHRIKVNNITKVPYSAINKLQKYNYTVHPSDLIYGQNVVELSVRDDKGGEKIFKHYLHVVAEFPVDSSCLANMRFNNYTKTTISLAELVNHIN
jgi:hypothetical protein